MTYNRVKCPKCNKDFGQEVKFIEHLNVDHHITDHFGLFLEIFHNGIHPTCNCSETCSEKLSWSGWKKGFTSKYVRGHNARIDSTWFDKEKQKEYASKRSEGYKTGRISAWNLGLTKETDARIKKQSEKVSSSLKEAYETGKIIDWRKLDAEKAKIVADKSSKTKRDAYANGQLVPWNKGLTKETDDRLLNISKKISARFSLPDAGKRVKRPELKKRIEVFSEKFCLLSSYDEYTKRRVAKLDFLCLKCNTVQSKSLAMLEESPICYACHPKESKGQLELLDFIKSLGVEATSSDRTIIPPKELDIYVPSRKFAIEYNGLYWHSQVCLDDKYHQNKLEIARSVGVNLLQIYEDEWRDKRSIIESMIRHRLGCTHKKLHARKLKFGSLSKDESRQFFDRNHLEGCAQEIKTLALFDADEPVAAMSLRRPFHKQYATYFEVARCCTTQNVSISGWLGKLTREAFRYSIEKEKLGLITYVDERVGRGSSYATSGWKLFKSSTGCRFWWTDFVNRYNRFSVKACSSKGITQAQAAIEKGVVPIFGCSNTLWKFT